MAPAYNLSTILQFAVQIAKEAGAEIKAAGDKRWTTPSSGAKDSKGPEEKLNSVDLVCVSFHVVCAYLMETVPLIILEQVTVSPSMCPHTHRHTTASSRPTNTDTLLGNRPGCREARL